MNYNIFGTSTKIFYDITTNEDENLFTKGSLKCPVKFFNYHKITDRFRWRDKPRLIFEVFLK